MKLWSFTCNCGDIFWRMLIEDFFVSLKPSLNPLCVNLFLKIYYWWPIKKNGSVVITGFCSLSSTKYITGVEYTYRNWKRMYENKKMSPCTTNLCTCVWNPDKTLNHRKHLPATNLRINIQYCQKLYWKKKCQSKHCNTSVYSVT